MSTINPSPVWYPPQFPVQGRLPSRPEQVWANLERRTAAERAHHDALSLKAGRRVSAPCCKSLNITLCFDGTGNNLNNDLFESKVPHPTNIARMFRASIGAGHVGGTTHRMDADRLTDAFGAGQNEYFKYYIPGVGTPFPEVEDLDYSTFGLALASYGEERIHWGLLMIIDALRRALGLPRKEHTALLASVNSMGTHSMLERLFSESNRARQFRFEFMEVCDALRIAMAPNPGQCQLLGLQLYVYGFSRGAAAARAFVSWLNELLVAEGTTHCLQWRDVKLPVSVEYLGVLDTVASVGLANFNWFTTGHMSWADNTQQIPDNGLVRRCLHIVASHEQRLCFPLDSIRRESGAYPLNSIEVLHPGVHSDQGGGYPPGDQGKASGSDDGLLLSQISLNDLYLDAFSYGAPLKVPKEALPVELQRNELHSMSAEGVKEFCVSSVLVRHFNAWRQVTLDLVSDSQPLSDDKVGSYQPLLSNKDIKEALRAQMAWITAWRIDRYAFYKESLLVQSFYKQATDTDSEEKVRERNIRKHGVSQAVVEHERKVQLYRENKKVQPVRPAKPGVPDFDPDMAQTQLREAAEEFASDYRRGSMLTVSLYDAVGLVLSFTSRAGLQQEFYRLVEEGQAFVSRLFPPPVNEKNHMNKNRRGNVDESRNADKPEGLLRALFDDQVHDSRAWFLYWNTFVGILGYAHREPFGSYLRDRMVFFGDTHSRKPMIYDSNDKVISPEEIDLLANEGAKREQMPVMDAEHMAQVQKDIDTLFGEVEADSDFL